MSGPVCYKGYACGNSCISRSQRCTKPPGRAVNGTGPGQGGGSCGAPSFPPQYGAPQFGCPIKPRKPSVCSKGYACGNACISRKLPCTKPRGTAVNASELGMMPMPDFMNS